ncbi:MAG: RecX family transcriptional regulator [Nitrospirota bacterium]
MRGFQNKARQYALKLLSYRGRSEKELEGRLRKKGFPEGVISSTLEHLRHIGLINDGALAESLRREALTSKLLGQNGVRRFMLSRGIPGDIVSSFLNPDEKEDIENARKLVNKKLRTMGNYSSEAIKRRLHNLLLRKGYSHETIRAVLRDKNFDEED